MCYTIATIDHLTEKFKTLDEKLLNLLTKRKLNFLDIGAGNGRYSVALKNLGFNVTAIDEPFAINYEIYSSCKKNGIDLIEADFYDYNNKEITGVLALFSINEVCPGLTRRLPKLEIAIFNSSARFVALDGFTVIKGGDYLEIYERELAIYVRNDIYDDLLKETASKVADSDLHQKLSFILFEDTDIFEVESQNIETFNMELDQFMEQKLFSASSN